MAQNKSLEVRNQIAGGIKLEATPPALEVLVNARLLTEQSLERELVLTEH